MKLVNNIMELYPERITNSLPDALFTSLMQSIAFGLEHEDTQISRLAFDAVAALGKEERKNAINVGGGGGTDGAPLARALDTFLHQILTVLFFGDYDADLVQSTAAETLHQLMLARTASVMQAVDGVLQRALDTVAGMHSAAKLGDNLRHAIMGVFAPKVEQVVSGGAAAVLGSGASVAQSRLAHSNRKQLKDGFEAALLEALSTVRGVVRVK